jgi:cysteine synthase A
MQAHDGDAILMSQKLPGQLRLAVVISSGANVIGVSKLKEELGKDKDAIAARLLCDDNKKYLSTDLMKVEPIREDYRSAETNFTGYRQIGWLSNYSYEFLSRSGD